MRRVSYGVLVGKLDGKRPFGRSRCRWGDNIKISLQETGHEDVNWIHLSRDSEKWRADVKAVINIRVLSIAGKFLTM
jgi:hypothetical protein